MKFDKTGMPWTKFLLCPSYAILTRSHSGSNPLFYPLSYREPTVSVYIIIIIIIISKIVFYWEDLVPVYYLNSFQHKMKTN